MTPTLQIATLLTVIATAAAFTPFVVPPGRCQGRCQRQPRGFCTKQTVECLIAPCPEFYDCVTEVDEYETNPCALTTCLTGHRCVVGKPKKGSPIAVCVPPCVTEGCGPEGICVMEPVHEGYEEAKCVQLPHTCPSKENQLTCANILCIKNTTCEMKGCKPRCIPL